MESSIAGKGYIFTDDRTFSEYEYRNLDDLKQGEVLLNLRISTICGSDLHTYLGDRTLSTPLNIGHEGVGTIEKKGPGVTQDAVGNELSEGDTVVFLPYMWCNHCKPCLNGNKTLCDNRKSIGSIRFDKERPVPTGTFSEYLVLPAGAEFIRVSDSSSNFGELAPINCSLSTMIHAFNEHIPQVLGKNVAIMGAGALGLYSAALAQSLGAERIITVDKNQKRLDLSRRFGATDVINTGEGVDIKDSLGSISDGSGADVIIDVAGFPPLAEAGLKALGKGGTFVEVGTIFPATINNVELHSFIRKGITIKGVSTYQIRHLREAYKFLSNNRQRYPFHEIVGKVFDIEDIADAFETARAGEYVRVGLSSKA